MNHPTAARPAPVEAHAARLRDSIAADPTMPVTAAVQGAGGHGKTALLDELARIYRRAGVSVHDAATSLPAHGGDSVVLVDDAHRLDEASLHGLRELAEDASARLVVAYRPWPRSVALTELTGVLGQAAPPVQLGVLSADAIAARAERSLATPVTPQLLEQLRASTGGVPRLVSRMLDALGNQDPIPRDMSSRDMSSRDASRRDPATADGLRVPRIVLDRFHHDLDRLDGQARQCLLAVAVGATPHPALLATLLDTTSSVAGNALAEVRASGLVAEDDTVLPLARQAVLALTPWEHRLAVTSRLAGIQLERGGPVLGLVRPLLGSEVALEPEETMAAAFERGGDEALPGSPRLAVRLFDAAVAAGAAAPALAARRARAAATAGDLDEALRTADRVIVDETAPDRAMGIQVAASVLAHRGLLARSAELCRWSVGNVRWPGDVAFSVVGLVGTGRAEQAAELMRSSVDNGPPTSLSGATTQLAEGLYESVAGSPETALSTLVRSASLAEPVGHTMLVPDTPAAVAAVVALHCGEFDVAESLTDRAIESGAGGPLLRTRHALLAAWVPLLRGDTVTARRKLLAATEQDEEPGMRDRLTAVAIEAGIAGRDNDMTALSEVRGRARKAVAEHPADLFTLLPLGELVLATARLRDQDWLVPYLREARSVLESLGTPPLWSALLHWKCLQAAIVLDQHDQVREHARALEGVAGRNALCTALSDAAATWLRILAGDVDQAEVERTARALHAAGLAWDGARLAGQAAIRTSDRRVMLALLECARALQGKTPRPQKHPATAGTGAPDPTDMLSGREREVAELVVAGLTYKQVGKRLFISAKTVEHHIGRIKQRLGCTDREDLLTQLRTLVGG